MNKPKVWIPLIIFIVIAVSFRLYRNNNEHYYILAGSDGPYFAVQVKSLFRHYKLAFPDMPLLFVLSAMLAKILYFLHIGNEIESILMSIRFIDSFLPPLAAIPVFCIVRELQNNHSKFANYLLIAFSILSFTPLYIFSFQLQKNGLATVLIFFYLYFVLKLLKYKNKKDAIKSIIVLIICALTHFGSFGLLIFFSLLIVASWFLFQKNKWNVKTLKAFLGAISIFIIALLVIAAFDYTRFLRIINIPLKIFEAPVLLFALHGQNFVLHGQALIILIFTNTLAIVSLFILVKKRKQIDDYKFVVGFAMAIAAMLLSNPFLGLEWASRLFMMAYIPTVVTYLIIYNSYSNKWIKITTIPVFLFLLILSLGSAIFIKSPMSIDESQFNELQKIRERKLFTKDDAIVARQSVRILSNWVFETKGVDKYLLSKSAFNKYPSVYLIKQIKGKNPLLRGAEPNIGNSQISIWKGEYFEIFKITNNIDLPDNPQKIFKGIRGTIQTISTNKMLVVDYKINKPREVFFNVNNKNFPKLSVGMKVEVNGEWMPFSISINAETIKEIESFEE